MINKDLQHSLDNPDLLVLSGSRLYGTALLNSDYDYRGFVIPPFDYLVGIHKFKHQVLKVPDRTVYSLVRYVELLVGGDPNCIELLFVPRENIISASYYGQTLLENRDLFLSKRMIPRVLGYAVSELRYFEKDKSQFKRASHAIRLLGEVLELLEHRTLTFPRPNADELLILKREVNYGALISHYNELIEFIYKVELTCKLPDHPPLDKINNLVHNMICDSLIGYMEEQPKIFDFGEKSRR